MIKLISVNIEMDMHHEKLVPFLKNENPDVICLQEVFEKDIHLYESAFGMKSFFKPMSLHFSAKDKEKNFVIGVAILTRHEASFDFQYYEGEGTVPLFIRSKDLRIEANIEDAVVIWAEIKIEENLYRIATTHLPVTFEGISAPYQIQKAEKLLAILAQFEDVVICGDLNAPRGNATFSMFKEKYKDNIPLEYESSIDPKLHRVQGLKFMVDGLFSTPGYDLKDIKLVEGVSDHKAIVGYIEKKY